MAIFDHHSGKFLPWLASGVEEAHVLELDRSQHEFQISQVPAMWVCPFWTTLTIMNITTLKSYRKHSHKHLAQFQAYTGSTNVLEGNIR